MRPSSITALILLAHLLAAPAFGDPGDTRPIVPASEILAKIERGEPVVYSWVIIVGDLDLHGLNLPKGDLKLIESEISITYSEIRGDVNFGLAAFKKPVTFRGTNFTGETLFFGSNFNSKDPIDIGVFGLYRMGSPDFSSAEFNEEANFLNAEFSGNANFEGAKFREDAIFNGVKFFGEANFRISEFSSGGAYFGGAVFQGGDADFQGVVFGGNANFMDMKFTIPPNSPFGFGTGETVPGCAYFREAEFNGKDANFEGAVFSGGNAYFETTKFNGNARFGAALFIGDAYFGDALCGGDAIFRGAQFRGDYANFNGAEFSNDVNFELSSFDHVNLTMEDVKPIHILRLSDASFENKSTISLKGTEYARLYVHWDSIKDAIIYNGEVYLTLVKNFKNIEYFEDADACYYQYRRERQSMRSWLERAKYVDILAWLTCGYGVRPGYTLGLGFFAVLASAVYYWRTGAIRRLKGNEEENANFWDAFYFSTMTFTTVGYGDWYPLDQHRKVVMLEGIVGWLTLSLFLVTLANVIIR
jgi:uncharacterized protein YjbI with pentapeptide repeats